MSMTPGQVMTAWRQMRHSIRELRKMGLDERSVRKLQDAGPACGGLELARELLATGPEGVRAVAELSRQEVS